MKIKGTATIFLHASKRIREGAMCGDRSPGATLYVRCWDVCFQHITKLLILPIFSFLEYFQSYLENMSFHNQLWWCFPLKTKKLNSFLEVWHARPQQDLFCLEILRKIQWTTWSDCHHLDLLKSFYFYKLFFIIRPPRLNVAPKNGRSSLLSLLTW